MPRMVLSLDGVVLREVNLAKERTTVGRRSHNDLVIDNLAVSGEHAVVFVNGSDVYLEDLGSTNGTTANRKPATIQVRQPGNSEDAGQPAVATIKILTGANSGRELALVKALTTIGRPGHQVAVITRRPTGYFIAHVEGEMFPTVNGSNLGSAA